MVALLAYPRPAFAATFDTEAIWGTTADNNWEPSVAADPSSSYVYEVTTSVANNPHEILFRASSDGGSTWGPTSLLCDSLHSSGQCAKTGWQADPHLAVASNGTIYAVFMETFTPGPVVMHSTDHGQTRSTPVPVSTSGKFRDEPEIAISPSGKDIYVTANGGNSVTSYIAYSHDYGATFHEVQTSNDGLWWFAWGPGVVTANGIVYFAFDAETGSISQQNTEIVTSTDGGVTWNKQLIDTSLAPPPCKGSGGCGNYQDFWGDHPSMAQNPKNGTFMVAYGKNTVANAPLTLYVRTSADGTNWSAPVLVNSQGNSSFTQLAAGTTAGDFRLAWQDNRNGQSSWNTWFTQTTNNGANWSAQVQLSDLGSGAAYKTPSGYTWPYGDYLGLTVGPSGVNYVIWGEGTGLYSGGGSWYSRGM